MSEETEVKKALFNTILCIDDSDIDTFIAEKVLIRDRIAEKVIRCHFPEKGLVMLKEMEEKNELPDRIMLDINMPGMTGFEFLKQYEKQFKSGPGRCKVIVLSSSENFEDQEQALSFNSVRGFLKKPLTNVPADKLLEVMQTLAPM